MAMPFLLRKSGSGTTILLLRYGAVVDQLQYNTVQAKSAGGPSISIAHSSTKRRVLVVEDERHIARYLEFVLRKEGYEVATAYDGEEALRCIESYRPDALLLDLVLPGMSGTDLLAAIRADRRFEQVVIIVLSARTSSEDTELLASANVQAQCAKPVAPSTLLRKLAEFGVRPSRGSS